MSVGLFWGSFAVVPTLPSVLGVVVFLIGFASGWFFYVTLYRIWNTPMFVWPGRGYFSRYRRSAAVIVSTLRPTFLRSVFRATGWPPVVVACVLAALLAVALVVALVVVPTGSQSCPKQGC